MPIKNTCTFCGGPCETEYAICDKCKELDPLRAHQKAKSNWQTCQVCETSFDPSLWGNSCPMCHPDSTTSATGHDTPYEKRVIQCNTCGRVMRFVGIIDSLPTWVCQKCNATEFERLTQTPAPQPLLLEAHALINGPRREAYGPVEESFKRVASVWSAILQAPVTPRQVALCMAGLKLCREANAHSRDNCLDGSAYFALADQVSNLDAPPPNP